MNSLGQSSNKEYVRTPATSGLVNAEDERILTYAMREHPEPRPRDDKDAAQDIARELAKITARLASLDGEVNTWLSDPNDTLKLRL